MLIINKATLYKENMINLLKYIDITRGILLIYNVLVILGTKHGKRIYAYSGDEQCPKSRRDGTKIK
jgi:hypothetical protein